MKIDLNLDKNKVYCAPCLREKVINSIDNGVKSIECKHLKGVRYVHYHNGQWIISNSKIEANNIIPLNYLTYIGYSNLDKNKIYNYNIQDEIIEYEVKDNLLYQGKELKWYYRKVLVFQGNKWVGALGNNINELEYSIDYSKYTPIKLDELDQNERYCIHCLKMGRKIPLKFNDQGENLTKCEHFGRYYSQWIFEDGEWLYGRGNSFYTKPTLKDLICKNCGNHFESKSAITNFCENCVEHKQCHREGCNNFTESTYLKSDDSPKYCSIECSLKGTDKQRREAISGPGLCSKCGVYNTRRGIYALGKSDCNCNQQFFLERNISLSGYGSIEEYEESIEELKELVPTAFTIAETSGIYLWRINGIPFYIGQSINIFKRSRQHLTKIYENTLMWGFALNHKERSITVEILEEIENSEHKYMLERELFWTRILKPLSQNEHAIRIKDENIDWNFIDSRLNIS